MSATGPTPEQIRDFNEREQRELELVLGPLCEEHGYGRMMQVVAGMWDRKHPRSSWGGKAMSAIPKLTEALRVLKLVEWNHDFPRVGRCPVCRGVNPAHTPIATGHASDCALDKALGEA